MFLLGVSFGAQGEAESPRKGVAHKIVGRGKVLNPGKDFAQAANPHSLSQLQRDPCS